MEFLLLGPVEVRAGDHVVNCGGPRQRTVLAALAVDAGRPVLPDALIDRVWGSAPPDRARHALYVYVGRIREILRATNVADGAPARLLRGSGGYRLDVDPDCVDMYRFSRLVTEARDSASPDPALGTLFRRALDLWRGDPLADLSGEWVEQVREGWRQRRLEAALRWAATMLGTDDPGAAIGLLTELAGGYPLDESLATMLMRVLHAAGRTADALECYAKTRERLIDQLGVEPGADLQRAHLTVLRGESHRRRTDNHTSARPTALTPKPAELPADIADFTGRTEEVERLVDVLGAERPRPNDRAVAISVVAGRAGVGKTTLAIHVGHRLRAAFPDGQLYVDLRGADTNPVEPGTVLTRFCRALGVDMAAMPQSVDELAALFRSRMADRQLLVVLDNAASEAQVRSLIPGSDGCAVVVTSRRRLTGLPGADLMGLQAFESEYSMQLLARVVGQQRVDGQPVAAKRIARLCGHLPLALRVSGARLAARPHWDLATAADRLANERGRLDELVHADLDVRASLELSYRNLSATARATFRRIAFVRLPTYTVHSAAVVNDHCGTRWESIMEELADVHLLDIVGVDEASVIRYRFHDLIRLYAVERAERDEQPAVLARVVERLLHWFEATCGAANSILEPTRNRVTLERVPSLEMPFEPTIGAASRWLDSEWANIRAAVRLAVDHGHDEIAGHLSYFATALAVHHGQWTESLAIGLDALPAIERQADDVRLGTLRNSMGVSCLRLRRFDEALIHLRLSLSARRAAHDRRGEGATWNNIGMVYQNQFRLEKSVEAYGRGYECCADAGHPIGVAIAANNLGVAYLLLGSLDRSFVYLRESLRIRREQGDRLGEAYTLESLGETYTANGEHEEALRCFNESLAMDVGDRWLTGEIMRNIGLVYRQKGDHDRALVYSMRAAGTFRDAGDAHNEAAALIDAALVKLAHGDLRDARQLLTDAAILREQVPDAREDDRLRAAIAELDSAESGRRP